MGPGTAWLMALLMFFSLSRLHQEIMILARLRLPLLLSVCVIGLVLLQSGRWDPKHISRHWSARLLGVVALVSIVGVPFGIYPGASLTFLHEAFLRTLLLGALAWIVASSNRWRAFMIKGFAVGGLGACLLALWSSRMDNHGRLSGAQTYDPNDISLIAVVTLPLVLWWALEKKHTHRWLAWLLMTAPLVVIIRAESRGAFVGLAAVLTVLVVAGMKQSSRRLKRWALVLAVAAVGSFPFLPSDYSERILTIFSMEESGDYNLTAETGRMKIWKRGIGYAMDYPIFGVGINNFPTAEGTISYVAQNREPGRGFKWSTAHNAYIQVLAETGFIGGLAFLAVILKSLWELFLRATRRRSLGESERLMAMGLGLSLLGYAVTAIFLSVAYYDVLYLLLGIIGAFLVATPDPGPRADRALA